VNTSDSIEINPEIMLGKPVIRGTRITVELLLRKLSEGAAEGDLLDAHPHLTRDDIKAAIAYAADTIAALWRTDRQVSGQSSPDRPAS
jgi:uncharacterized protein (DUF433 family)